MIAILRETRANRYTLNALTGILDACELRWGVAESGGSLIQTAAEVLRRGEKPLVLYSFMTPHLLDVREEIVALKSQVRGATLIAGGPHPSADPEGTLLAGFDHVFIGEVERTLPAFLRTGACGGPVQRDPAGGPTDLDGFAPYGVGRHGPVEITRGCPYACGFCGVGRRRVRHRGREAVLGAAETLLRGGRRRLAFITPDAFAYGRGLADLEPLLRDLRSMGMRPALGTFPSEVRPDRVTPEAMQVLHRYAENRTLVIGAQSGSDSVLERLGRGHTVADVVRAAQTARRAGFTPHVDVIFGLPGESVKERRITMDLVVRLRAELGARIHAHYFHPLPGTPLWGQEPTPLDGDTRRALLDLRRGGAEDGQWQEQERWAHRIVEWAKKGWIRTSPSPQADTQRLFGPQRPHLT